MVTLYDQNTGQPIGEITVEQLRFLMDQLEEESMEDTDYAITPMTVAYLDEQGADPGLLAMLRGALGDRPEMTIRWAEA